MIYRRMQRGEAVPAIADGLGLPVRTVRTLVRRFRDSGGISLRHTIGAAPPGQRPATVADRARRPHEVWQMDAADQKRLRDGGPISWLRVADECSGTGLDHYEVRSRFGWHHHMTLSLVELWFLCLERRRAGGESPGDHGTSDAPGVHEAAPTPGIVSGGDRGGSRPCAAA